jgi:pimeloyl-ACP methyl ester carboxylesterase
MTRSIASTLLAFASLQLAACGTAHEPRIADHDSRDVEVVTTGSGTTTVVFESGLGDDSTTWDDVVSEVALHARVFAYSRPGYGSSAPAETERDPLTIVEELQTLLVAEEQKPPYILVGHSAGGGYVELFAKTYPDEVIGVVLVDPRHRDFLTECTEAGIAACGIPDSVIASLPAVEAAEYLGYAKASEQIGAAGSFGPIPVRVLTSTDHSASPAWEELWQSTHGALAAEALQGEQILFPGSGHYLQNEHPHDVAQRIVELVPPR